MEQSKASIQAVLRALNAHFALLRQHAFGSGRDRSAKSRAEFVTLLNRPQPFTTAEHAVKVFSSLLCARSGAKAGRALHMLAQPGLAIWGGPAALASALELRGFELTLQGDTFDLRAASASAPAPGRPRRERQGRQGRPGLAPRPVAPAMPPASLAALYGELQSEAENAAEADDMDMPQDAVTVEVTDEGVVEVTDEAQGVAQAQGETQGEAEAQGETQGETQGEAQGVATAATLTMPSLPTGGMRVIGADE